MLTVHRYEVATIPVDVCTLAEDSATSTEEIPAKAYLPHVFGSLSAKIGWVYARLFNALTAVYDSSA